MLKIGAFVTAYNDYVSVLRFLKSVLNQTYKISKILVIDNSKKSLFSRTSLKKILDKNSNIIVRHYPENIGVARAIQKAIDWANQENLDYLWLFDQDSVPEFNALELLVNFINLNFNKDKIGIIASLPIDPNNKKEFNGANYDQKSFFYSFHLLPSKKIPYELDVTITAGSLVCIKSVNQISQINSDFFIDSVDFDLCLKFRDKNYKIIIVPSSIVWQTVGSPILIKIKFINRLIYCSNHNYLRLYYINRNTTYLETRRCQKKQDILRIVIKRLLYLLYTIIRVIFEPKNKAKKIFFSCVGLIHGFLGILGKIKN